MHNLQDRHDSIHLNIRTYVSNWFKDMDAFKLGCLIGAIIMFIGFILMVPAIARLFGWLLTALGGTLFGACLVVLLDD